MYKNIYEAPFVKEMCEATANMYRLGWGERNAGNISCLLDEREVCEYLDLGKVIRTIPIGFDAGLLSGKIFIVTGTGKYFKNIEKAPERDLGIVRIAEDGVSAELLWGYSDGGKFTSEFPSHMMSHAARLSADPSNKVVLHTHPTYTVAMSAVCLTDEREFILRLWRCNTEGILVFPDGLGVLPSMVCGTNEIAEATAEKMKKFRLVVWTNHGIYGSGQTLDEAFGLIEAVEKSAQIYMLTLGHAINTIPDSTLKEFASFHKLTPLEGIFD